MSISSVSSASSTVTTTATQAAAAAKAAKAFNATIQQLKTSIDRFESQTTWHIDHGQDATLPSDVTASDPTDGSAATTSKTIADGFAGLESNAQSALTNLTPDQQKQFTTLQAKLSSETARFQGFINRRASSLAKAGHHVDAQTTDVRTELSDFESQVTWQIDHGETPTSPKDLKEDPTTTAKAATAAASTTSTDSTTAATSTAATSSTDTTAATTLAQTIANGFAAIEADATTRLKNAPWQLQAKFEQLQKNLTAEATRFTTFATRRAAYRAANPKEITKQDATA